MNELTNTKAIVKEIMEKDTQCRNSDSLLYLRVITHIANRSGIDIDSVTVPYFLRNLHGDGFPGFETVRRTRQKIQQHHPELSACGSVAGYRAKKEKEYRDFAREEA